VEVDTNLHSPISSHKTQTLQKLFVSEQKLKTHFGKDKFIYFEATGNGIFSFQKEQNVNKNYFSN